MKPSHLIHVPHSLMNSFHCTPAKPDEPGYTYANRQLSEKKAFLYKQLPPEFINYIEGAAYERGHSAGMDEVDAVATSMSEDLIPYLEQYCTRKGITNSIL